LLSALLLSGCNGLRESLESATSSVVAVTEPCDSSASPFGGGDGSTATPYLISFPLFFLKLLEFVSYFIFISLTFQLNSI
jgi:hypothetical protein